MDYYLAIERNEVLTHAITRVNFMLGERSQSPEKHIIQFHVYEMSRISQSIQSESR